MKLNIINNYKAIYYNLLVNFYLIINTFIPLYDDVVISMHNETTKHLYNFKNIKKLRMIELLNDLKNKDKILYDDEKKIISIEYNYDDYLLSENEEICYEDSDNEKCEEDSGKEKSDEDSDKDITNIIKDLIKKIS